MLLIRSPFILMLFPATHAFSTHAFAGFRGLVTRQRLIRGGTSGTSAVESSLRMSTTAIDNAKQFRGNRNFRDVVITSEKHEKVQMFRSVLESSHYRKKSGLRIVEGFRIIKDAISNQKLYPKELMLSEKAAATQQGKDLLRSVLQAPQTTLTSQVVTPIVVEDKVIDGIADTVATQGFLALFHLPEYPIKELVEDVVRKQLNKQSAMMVITDGVSDPGNCGTLIRSCAGFGADGMIVIGGCDPWSPKAIRSSMGAVINIPLSRSQSWAEVLEAYASSSISSTTNTVWTIYIADGLKGHSSSATNVNSNMKDKSIAGKIESVCYYEADFRNSFTLVIGSETNWSPAKTILAAYNKLSVDMKAKFNLKLIHIPMDATASVESFNAAIAGSIIMSEASRQRKNVIYK